MKEITKKIILYELVLENFLDTNQSGFGDFNGVLSKIDYFKKLGINIVAIEDILKQYENSFDLSIIKNKFGSIKDYVNLIKVFQQNKIKIAPIINLKKIKQSYINWNNMMGLYNLNEKDNEQYLTKLDPYLINEEIDENSLYEISNFIKYFESILDFYLRLNTDAIILDNFEFLAFESLKEDEKLKFIKDIYKIIKTKKPTMTVIFKTDNNNFGFYNKMLKQESKCFDYLYLTWISKIGNNEIVKDLNKKQLNFKGICNFLNLFNKSPNIIITFGSNLSGRFISKWGSENSYFYESAKTFFMMLYSGNNSIGIYYGDEIGTLRAKVEKNFNFNNEDYNEEKRFFESKNISIEEFFIHNNYFNKWSSYTQMAWDDKEINNKNKNKNFFRSIKYKENNVEKQLKNSDSIINFVLFLNNLTFNSKYKMFFENAKTIMQFKNGVFYIKKNLLHKKIVFVINLSKKHKRILGLNNFSILSSSYANKFYSELPKELSPFESIILLNEDN
ncbi:alpha-amylase family glycosyl hydrolase [Metamycoplasma gateae]|uniref:Alpha-amylase family glycosyl hydrolase n=1 Tax=Metamycoplasma gateae TaxID=35769 RepID=A0ABZ2ALE0_9BACT|nr:alpha-amylase family glycosyl hydrolase [Metamycoplasma gateae]